MGTWGTGTFDSDLASDLRSEMRDLFAEGDANWARTILQRWDDALQDPDDREVVLLAMAETAWDAGRVDAAIHKRALDHLSAGSELVRFDSQDRPARKRALAALQRKLERVALQPKRISIRETHATALEVGDLVALRLPSKKWIALAVWNHHQDRGGRFAIADVLDWVGKARPTGEALAKVQASGAWFKQEPHWRQDPLRISGLRSARYVVARDFARPSRAHLGPPLGLFAVVSLAELPELLAGSHRMKLG